jgi:hypothetical protein
VIIQKKFCIRPIIVDFYRISPDYDNVKRLRDFLYLPLGVRVFDEKIHRQRLDVNKKSGGKNRQKDQADNHAGQERIGGTFGKRRGGNIESALTLTLSRQQER